MTLKLTGLVFTAELSLERETPSRSNSRDKASFLLHSPASASPRVSRRFCRTERLCSSHKNHSFLNFSRYLQLQLSSSIWEKGLQIKTEQRGSSRSNTANCKPCPRNQGNAQKISEKLLHLQSLETPL
ncbi:hypothetical protein MHYP_G00264290 [Metynnis hypsauchen]